MKKKISNLPALICLLFITLFSSCNSKKAKNSEYNINAEIKGVNSGQVLLAKLDLVTNEQVNVDSTEIINGRFSFNGSVESPYLHTLFINGKSDKIHLFLENSNIDISGNISNLETIKVSGSREDSLFRSYPVEEIFDRKIGKEIMLNYPDYTYSAFVAYYQFQIHNIQADTLEHIMNSFSAPVKKTIYFKHLDTLYNTIKKVAISQPAPNFSMKDNYGNIVKLSEFKGKYILIDFWASWCAPCRASNPDLVKAYNALNKRGFTIVGISVDKNKKRWLKAIKEDELPWTNLSNLKGWDEVSNMYGVKAVPQNFLLDTNGIIIDKNIEPELLIEKLNDILPKK